MDLPSKDVFEELFDDKNFFNRWWPVRQSDVTIKTIFCFIDCSEYDSRLIRF